MKYRITEEQYKRIFLGEEENIFYNPNNSNGKNLDALWEKIFEKQKELNDYIFDEIDDFTRAKANLVDGVLGNALKNTNRDDNLLQIPKVMMDAGNDKLPQNVLVINITSSLTCPSFYMGLCKVKNATCYAQQFETRLWHNTGSKNMKSELMNTELLRRYQKGDKNPMKEYFSLVEMYINIGNAAATNIRRNMIESLRKRGIEPNEQQLETIKMLSEACKITDIRLNEVGDFPCQLSVNLWSKFAKKLGKKYGIKVHAYTARGLDFSNTPENFSIMPSRTGINIGDEPYREYKIISDEDYDSLEGGDSIGKDRQPILGTDNDGKKFYKCPCTSDKSECGLCGVCMNKNKTGEPYTIYVKQHGKRGAKGLSQLYTSDEISGIMNMYKSLGWTGDKENGAIDARPGLQKTKDLDAAIIARREKNPNINTKKD
jgi:hypothetical protein